MEFAIRVFFIVKNKIKRIGVDRFSKIGSETMPENAGQKIPYAVLVFEREDNRLGDLRYHEGGYLVIDKEGKVDESRGLNQVRLVQSGENDPKSFAARRGAQFKKENTWIPTGEQLNQMIKLAKRNG
jgi:hypothetical protein